MEGEEEGVEGEGALIAGEGKFPMTQSGVSKTAPCGPFSQLPKLLCCAFPPRLSLSAPAIDELKEECANDSQKGIESLEPNTQEIID